MTARTGMAALITQLRGMCSAGTTDYTIGTTSYWTDDQLQSILDLHRTDIFQKELMVADEFIDGMYEYIHFSLGNKFIESGDQFTLYDFYHNEITTGFTVDYALGLVTFDAPTNGMVFYATYRTYDINSAASDVWKQKAGHYADKVTIKAGNQSVNLSDQMAHALQMASYYAMQAGPRSISFEREDTC